MPELILAVHNGPHDAVAAVLVDYELKAAVQLERLTRVKGDGGFPDLSIEEALGIVGAVLPSFPRLALAA
jgi:carbamoyltransferase